MASITDMQLAPQAPQSEQADGWRTALHQFDATAEILHLEPQSRSILREVKREFTCNFPVQMDDGSTPVFTGYRVQHNIVRGPAKGGIRAHRAQDRHREDQDGYDGRPAGGARGLLWLAFGLGGRVPGHIRRSDDRATHLPLLQRQCAARPPPAQSSATLREC